MLRFGIAAVALAALLAFAATAHAGKVMSVDGATARMVRDPLLPRASKTALPPVPRGTRIVAPAIRARAASLPTAERKEYEAALADAKRTRDALPAGAARAELSAVIANARRSTRAGSSRRRASPRR